jgi:hypothetical protein
VRLAAAVVAAAAIAAAAGAAASPQAVLGWDYANGRLAWFDPATLTPLPGRKVPMRGGCSWSFSPDRARLASTDCQGTITFVNARTMRRVGSLSVSGGLLTVEGLVWLRPDRLLATSTQSTVLVIDPRTPRLVRRVDLPGPVQGRATLADGRVAYLLSNAESFGPARVAVVDADGNMRAVVLDRITVGSAFDADSSDPSGTIRSAGFAVDGAGNRAFVVSPELLVAEVDLLSLAVAYHGPTRVLAKTVEGPARSAAWLGDGLLAVAGVDYSTTTVGKERRVVQKPFGLHLVDTRTWTIRLVDPTAEWFQRAGGLLVVQRGTGNEAHTAAALTPDGTERYRVELEARAWLEVSGAFAYVCRDGNLLRVIDTATGAATPANGRRPCVALLAGPASDF